ncbi:hypothetical protein CVS53_02321 [Microbacterium oxydans]|nr:hypothetical protein CVS53_02321 [Microbacterium oxydans]
MATPADAAARSSPSRSALAIPRRRWVAATVTTLIAHIPISAPPGTVRGVIQPSMVATGSAAAGAFFSYTPTFRRSAKVFRAWASMSLVGSGPRNPRSTARSKPEALASSLRSTTR